tara:strand:- start:512 stop:877 length:366 start_codon:yes stop_codon:yes gene_type:complete
MYESNILNRKDYPVLNAMLKRAIPGYKKHKIIAITCSGFEPPRTTWGGGIRESYYAWMVTGDGGQGHVPAPSAPSQFGGGEVKTYSLEAGIIAISTGTFQGRTATAKVYALPADMETLTCS